jgi:dUTP pyrophosphatase
MAEKSSRPTLKVFRTFPNGIELPKFATEGSACFDLAFSSYGKARYDGYSSTSGNFNRPYGQNGTIKLMPHERVMAPTGLIFEIPKGYSLRIHPRSSVAYKKGLILVNCEAVIDADYFHETFLLLLNTSEAPIDIFPGDRIAQAELVRVMDYTIKETLDQPEQTTDREGGIGSSGR